MTPLMSILHLSVMSYLPLEDPNKVMEKHHSVHNEDHSAKAKESEEEEKAQRMSVQAPLGPPHRSLDSIYATFFFPAYPFYAKDCTKDAKGFVIG